MRRRYLLFILLLVAGAFALAACGGDDDETAPAEAPAAAEPPAPAPAPEPAPEPEPAPAPEPAPEPAPPPEPAPEPAPAEAEVSGEISLMGIWQDVEADSIEAVLDGFREQFPEVTVNYDPAGDQLVTLLSTAIEGGNPPDLATIAQPGTIAELAGRGELIPIDFAQEAILGNFGQSVVDLGTIDGTLYWFPFKAASKNTVWYNVAALDAAGVEPPATLEELTANADTIKASGLPAYSIGGADGWTLTDLFENIYLRTAGAEVYDQLARHEIPWTDQSVKDALAAMAEILGDSDNIAGGTDGALQTDFPGSVSNVFTEDPAASMVIEGDFVPGVVETTLEPVTGYNVFPFPSIAGSPPSVVGGGDGVVLLKDNPAARALVEYLASPEAAAIWVQRGGFLTLNKKVDSALYPDEIAQAIAAATAAAEVFRFDLSDLQPGEFGGTPGQGLFKDFQDFLANPDDIDGITEQMEANAQAAFGS